MRHTKIKASIPLTTQDIAKELIALDNNYTNENVNTYINLLVLQEEAEKDMISQLEKIRNEWTNVTKKGIGEYFYNKYGLYFDLVNTEYIPETNILKIYVKMGLNQPASISNFDLTRFRYQ